MPAENDTGMQGDVEVGVGTTGGQDVRDGSPDQVEATAEEEPTSPPARRMSPTRKALLGTAVLLLLILSAAAVFAHVARDRVLGEVQRLPDVFAPIDESSRPHKSAGAENTVNFLLVGVDTRADEQTTGRDGDGAIFVPGEQRSDVIILVHLAADRRTATVVSIPRDSWVAVPGQGRDKINAAYSGGGGSLLVQTVERLTGLRIDHFAVVDFAGFKDITDALGGVDVRVLERTADQRGSYRAGMNHLDGAAALAYVRQRHNLPGGDLDRVRRQQSVIRAMMAKVASMHLLSNPARSLDLAEAAARSVSVDDSLSNDQLSSLALSVRHLKPEAVTFLTAPVRGLGHEGKQSVVYLDEPRSRQLWAAIKSDDVAPYVKANGADSLGGNPR
jgi:LCP family protein required for cell wall assembly